jgi:hypothetical protein
VPVLENESNGALSVKKDLQFSIKSLIFNKFSVLAHGWNASLIRNLAMQPSARI